MEASDDDESVNWYEEDTESEDDEAEAAAAAFEFDDDDSVEPVPDPADLVDQDGNAVHQLSIDRVVAHLGGEDSEDKEDSFSLRDAIKRIDLWPETSFDRVVQKASVAARPGCTSTGPPCERRECRESVNPSEQFAESQATAAPGRRISM
jgi:hypothetical protein